MWLNTALRTIRREQLARWAVPQAGRRTGGASVESLLPPAVWSVFYAAAARLRTASDKFFSDDPDESYSFVACRCSRGAERKSKPLAEAQRRAPKSARQRQVRHFIVAIARFDSLHDHRPRAGASPGLATGCLRARVELPRTLSEMCREDSEETEIEPESATVG